MTLIDHYVAFIITTSIFAFIPGPGMLYAVARTMAGGRQAGLMAALGMHVGSYFHVIAAAAGLSILFHAVPVIYTGVKIAGAAYLIWLGFCLFRSPELSPISEESRVSISRKKAFIQSITVEVLNPKTAIFFLAFLPQFVDSNAQLPMWVQFALLGLIVNIIFTLSDVVSVFMAGMIMSRIQGSLGYQKLARRTGGAILIGLGANLALQKS